MLSSDDFDCGILKFAIRGYADSKGISYDEALTEMARFQRTNPPPEDDFHHDKRYTATPEDAREAYHRAIAKYGTWKPRSPEEAQAVPRWVTE
jgi:hypothetical protein